LEKNARFLLTLTMVLFKKRLIGWIIFVFCVLLIPFSLMQFTDEINWDIIDFLIVGLLLCGIGASYELLRRKTKEATYRVAFMVWLLGALILFWVNAAVGIIGNEGQDANLLYSIVFIVGLVGALISRFKAYGMYITLIIASIVQMLIPAFALIIWPLSKISWSPGILGVFLLSGFFALLFFMSSMLFKSSIDKGVNIDPKMD
jgi:hypothetical protein